MLRGCNLVCCLAGRFGGGGAGGDRRLPLASGQQAHLQDGREADSARTVRHCYCSYNDDVIVMMRIIVIFIIYCWILYICVLYIYML